MIHMPAMNTPQFTWVQSRLPNLPQPVPQIYEPEVGAKAVLHAATSRSAPCEYWVGNSTVKAIIGQKFIPGLLGFLFGRDWTQSSAARTGGFIGTPEQHVEYSPEPSWCTRAFR